MKFWDLVKIANRNLLRSKLRTFLTIMAIFVGSFTLIMTNGLGDGLRDYVEKQVKDLEGDKILFVRRKISFPVSSAKGDEPEEYKEINKNEGGKPFDPSSLTITKNEISDLLKSISDIKTITPQYQIDAEYITLNGEKKYEVNLGMLSEGIVQKTEAGSNLSGTNQILLPLNLAKAFSPDINLLIGKQVTIGYKAGQMAEMRTMNLTIVGVSTKGFMSNIFSYVDTETAHRIYNDQKSQSGNYEKFTNLTVQLKDAESFSTVKKKLDEKGFTADTFADRQKRTYDAIGILQIGLNFFAFIALLAASFGIINTLVIAVMERTKEIGLQKALGMGRGKVFLLFSLESILIGFWGAVAGIVGGIVIGTITNIILGNTYLESFEGYNLFSFKPFSIIFVTLLVCIIAFLAGVLPAYRASRLNPIEALRYE
jgi:putative ABC transport system permease protein